MISVLIPVYNTNPADLSECVDSVLEQTFQDFEIVLVDNESTDQKTKNVLAIMGEHSHINLIKCQREIGKKNLSVALNYGLKHCQFELIARMDSDDVMLPERLEKQFRYMQEHPEVDILGTQLKNMFGTQHVTSHPQYIPSFFYKGSTFFLSHPTVMFKKSKILSLGGYPESPDFIPEDYVLWARALKAGMTIHNLTDILVRYRNKGTGLSDIDSKRPEWYEAIRKEMMS
jgi:glycosyltransferase involved in cell wall biosynthesis